MSWVCLEFLIASCILLVQCKWLLVIPKLYLRSFFSFALQHAFLHRYTLRDGVGRTAMEYDGKSSATSFAASALDVTLHNARQQRDPIPYTDADSGGWGMTQQYAC